MAQEPCLRLRRSGPLAQLLRARAMDSRVRTRQRERSCPSPLPLLAATGHCDTKRSEHSSDEAFVHISAVNRGPSDRAA